MAFLAFVLIAQLFNLQLVKGTYFAQKAEEGHLGYSEVTARRGDILIRDHHSGEAFRLATNTSLPTLFADPTLLKDSNYLADKLAPILFDGDLANEKEKQRVRQARRLLPEDATIEQINAITARSEEDLKKDYRGELYEKISQRTRESIILYQDPNDELKNFITSSGLSGVEISNEAIIVKPNQIGDKDYTAKTLAPVVEIPYERLRELLEGRNRYVILRTKVPPEVENQIRTLMAADKKAKTEFFTGVSFQEKYYRFYPEGQLAAQVVGFMTEAGGAYGIERSFDTLLRGKKGIFKTQLDATGQQVIVGDDLVIQPAIDGSSVMLTIDRSIQTFVERALAKMVQDIRADSGSVIIMEPQTGRIVAMAQYPTFDPNSFGKALETEDIHLSEQEITNIIAKGKPGEETYIWTIDPDSHYQIQLFKEIMDSGKIVYSKFKNTLGAGVYRNSSVSDIWEPGSIFKVIAMSIGIDDGDVTPNSTFNDVGPVKVDEFEIHNSTNEYRGITTMREVLERSLNTGMSFVARKIGRELFGKYLSKYGFGEKTEIEFDDEAEGAFEASSQWAESELLTHAFGQGIAVTPIQMITSVAAIANDGVLMKPQIIEEIQDSSGKTLQQYEPKEIRRVISEKSASTMRAMMASVVENGGANRARVPGYRIGTKTGTAQTYKNGVPLTGPGTTIASFIGMAPIDHPKFVMLVKIDRPRASIWADASAAPLFQQIAEFLFQYYNIPPDKNM